MEDFIPIIDEKKKCIYEISILYNCKLFSYHGLMYFPDYISALRYCKKYIKNILKLSRFFGESPYQIKQNYKLG